MAKRFCDQPSANRAAPASRPVPAYSEPEVRRWPHPIHSAQPASQAEDPLHYIRCALSYQNQLLAEIKSLLEQLHLDALSEQAEK